MTGQTYTRAARRKMRAYAKAAAPLLARACYDRNPCTGETALVAHPRAVAALERIFQLVLTEGGKVQVMRLTDATARAFPAFDPSNVPEGSKPWMAAGLDVDGRGAFSIRHIAISCALHPLMERRLAEATMHAEIAPSLARSGWHEEART